MKTIFLQRTLFAVLILTLALAASEGVAFASQRKSSPPLTDDYITDQVRMKLAADPVVKGGALQVDCRQGVVTLSGSMETEKQKARAERITKKVRGVKQVINSLVVKHN